MTTLNEPQIRFKGNLFARPDYFATDVTSGAIRTPSGTRVCTLTNDFLLGFREALIYECGKSSKSVMKACGKRWGKAFLASFEKELAIAYQTPMKNIPAGVVHACLADAFNYHGWGRLTIDLSLAEDGLVLVEIHDSPFPAVIKRGDRPCDDLTCGLLASIFSQFAGAELDAIQTDCPTCGDRSSRFVIASPDRISQIQHLVESIPPDGLSRHDSIIRQLLGDDAADPQAATHSIPE